MIYNNLEFKPTEEGSYYFIAFSDNEIYQQCYFGEQRYRHKNDFTSGNCFETKELAEEYLKMHNEIERLRKEYPVEWENRSEKYYLRYDCVIDEIYVIETCSIAIQGSFYISNEEVLQQFIKEYESSIKKFLFGIEEKEKLYFIKFPMFEYKNDLNYLNFNLEQECWYIEDNEELIDFNKTHFTKEECDKIIADNNLQNVVELERVE